MSKCTKAILKKFRKPIYFKFRKNFISMMSISVGIESLTLKGFKK